MVGRLGNLSTGMLSTGELNFPAKTVKALFLDMQTIKTERRPLISWKVSRMW